MLALGLQMVSDQARTYFLIKSFNNSVFVLTLSHRDRVKRWLSQTPKNVRSLVLDLDPGKLFTKTLGRGVRDKLVRANQTNLSKLFLLYCQLIVVILYYKTLLHKKVFSLQLQVVNGPTRGIKDLLIIFGYENSRVVL